MVEGSRLLEESGSGRRSAVEAIGNIYSPIAWLPPGYEPGAGDGCPAAGPFRPWDILIRRRGLDRGRGGESPSRSDYRACVHGTLGRPLRAQLAPGVHRSRRARLVTAVTAGTAGPTGRSSTAGTTCIATGPKAGQQRATQTNVLVPPGAIATSVAQASVLLASARSPCGGGAGLGRDRLRADPVARWRALGRAQARPG